MMLMLVVLISNGGESGSILGIVVVVIGCGGGETRENAASLLYVEIRGDPSRLPFVASLDAAVLGFCF